MTHYRTASVGDHQIFYREAGDPNQRTLLDRHLGKHDLFFIPAGTEAYRRDNPNAVVEFLNTGHFALETHFKTSQERV